MYPIRLRRISIVFERRDLFIYKSWAIDFVRYVFGLYMVYDQTKNTQQKRTKPLVFLNTTYINKSIVGYGLYNI